MALISYKSYDHGASVGAVTIGSVALDAMTIMTVGMLGGVFGGTLWGYKGWGVGAIIGSAIGYSVVRIRNESPKEA